MEAMVPELPDLLRPMLMMMWLVCSMAIGLVGQSIKVDTESEFD
jgi:hypothetical protein